MSKELMKSIAGLRSSAEQLNATADVLSELVLGIEQLLREELKVGTPIYLPPPPDRKIQFQLGYQRYDKKFRIVVLETNTNVIAALGVKESVKAWAECTRAVKVQSAKFLPMLVSEITKSVQSELSELNDASRIAATVLDSLSDQARG